MWYLFLWAVMVWEQISSPLPYHVIITSPYCPVSFLALPAYLGQTIATSIPPFPFPFLSLILYKPQKGNIDPAGLLSHNASVNAFAQGHRDDSRQEKELRIWQNASPFFFPQQTHCSMTHAESFPFINAGISMWLSQSFNLSRPAMSIFPSDIEKAKNLKEYYFIWKFHLSLYKSYHKIK